jgi:hypothetical protein
MPLTANSSATLSFSAQLNVIKNLGGGGLTNPNIQGAIQALNQGYTIGTGAGTFNWGSIGLRTVTAASPETIDLTSTLLSLDGTTCVFTDILCLVAIASSTNTGNLLLGNAAATAWSAFLGATGVATVLPGFTLALMGGAAAGYTVDSTHKSLKADFSSGTAQTYTLFVLGH